MSIDGRHYVCKKHKKHKYYSRLKMTWLCLECEFEEVEYRN
ncbi:MAG: hypothetical protein ABIH49_00890 [archaeon]